MTRNDATGLGVSLGLHLLLLLIFAFASALEEPEQPLGMIEVEFGPVTLAQPAARAETPTPPATPRPEPQPEPPTPRPQTAQQPPANLPTPPPRPQPEQTPRTRPDPAPQQQTQTRPQTPPSQPAPQQTTGGTPEGQTGTTAQTGEPGDATTRRAPFNLEGLNRTPVSAPLPTNPGAAGTVTLELCVQPDGTVSRAFPVRRSGTPSLDNSAMTAVRRWRFNTLPTAAPQAEQCGRISFYFTLG